MSAIAGIWTRGTSLPALALCEQLLDAQAAFGPHHRASAAAEGIALGRCLYRTLPEDRFDRQPLSRADTLLVADLRIDNREELLATLELGDGAELADSEILLRGWSRWREGLLERLLGDFAFAVWEPSRQRLILVRDPMGERPLHFSQAGGAFAFASLSTPLAGLPGMSGGADRDAIADFVADLPRRGPRSYHRDVWRVEPGHLVIADRGGVRARRWWDPRGPEISLPGAADYGEALRAEIDAAVRRRLRRAAGAVGSHLSGGLDSGAVAASAGLLLEARGERLQAFTSAPRAAFDGPAPSGYVADESAAAAAVAALHPNIDHHIVRPPARESPLPLLDRDHLLAGQPVGNVMNNLWWSRIAEEARDRGVTVMLTGEAGNFALSAGLGLDDLADLLRRGALARWLGESRALVSSGRYRWKNVLNASFGPALPPRAYRALRRLAGDYADPGEDLRLVAPARKAAVAARAATGGWDVAPSADSRERRWRMLTMIDPGNFRKRSLALWGIEERDPTADARLVRFCFSLPPEARLAHGVRRPALRAALDWRLPATALDHPVRGFQAADWHERIDAERVRSAFRPHAEAAADIVDAEALEAAARSWPTGNFADRAQIYFYRGKCLRALAAAHFVAASGT